jgi:amino acid adenylation domain-containing protein
MRMQSLSEQRRDLLERILERRKIHPPGGQDCARPLADEARFPASFAQERLWFLHKLVQVGSAYNVAMGLRMTGTLDIESLERACAELVRRHEVLRTRFEETEAGADQVVDARSEFRVANVDLSALDSSARDPETARILEQHAHAPFSLSAGPLIRVTLLKLSSHEHVLLIVLHHIVADAWSIGVLTREVGALYEAFSRGEPSPLPEPTLQYADYSVWQRQWLQGEVLQQQLDYWRTQLAEAPAALELPTDRPRPASASFAGATLPVLLSTQVSRKLLTFAKKERATPFMLLMAAFQVLLRRWSGQKDLVIGSPVAGRTLRQSEDLIGFFVNMLPMRSQVRDELSFREHLRRARETALDAYSYQDIPFEKLVAELRPERDLSRQPIFQVTFVLQNPQQQSLQLGDLKLQTLSGEAVSAKYDLSLYLEEKPDGIQGCFEYSTALFDRATIERLAGHFQVLLEAVAEDPDMALWQLPLMRAQERDRLLVEWNDTAQEYEQERCVHELFREQVARTPGAVALVCEDQQLTYSELDGQSEQLARYLRGLGVGPDAIVGLCLERGPGMVIGMLGILKAGGAYLPLDPGYPSARLAYMLEDAAPRVVLTQEHLKGSIPSTGATLVALDAEWDRILAWPDEHPPKGSSKLTSRHLAYVIYTSGSTGRPKGVMVEHAAVVNCLRSLRQVVGMDSSDSLLAVTTLSFDIAAVEIYLPLFAGAKVVLASRAAAADPRQLMEAMEEHGVTVMQATPATWQLLSDAGWRGRSCLRALSGGEALRTDLSGELLRQVASVWNLYGPTEATIWSSIERVTDTDRSGSLEPVGQPLANTQMYVLDEHLEPVPIGVAGEIYIGGVGVARGYLNRPGLTAERFVASSFAPGQRLYRTGDRARYLADGKLHFLGRLDQQVKIRGFRIELEEIEAALLRHTKVSHAVVLAREVEPGDTRLIAYWVAAEGALPSNEELRAHLKNSLPDYMVPAAFLEVTELPLTPNGKLDRNALPSPKSQALLEGGYLAPRTPTEELLAEIWADVLKVDRIGVHDNFFELGGHSLLTMRIVARIFERTQVSLPVWALFQSPSIASLAERLEGNSDSGEYEGSAELELEGGFQDGVI